MISIYYKIIHRFGCKSKGKCETCFFFFINLSINFLHIQIAGVMNKALNRTLIWKRKMWYLNDKCYECHYQLTWQTVWDLYLLYNIPFFVRCLRFCFHKRKKMTLAQCIHYQFHWYACKIKTTTSFGLAMIQCENLYW